MNENFKIQKNDFSELYAPSRQKRGRRFSADFELNLEVIREFEIKH